MHAYIIVGDSHQAKEQVERLARKLGAKILVFPLAKIEDVRALASFTNLSLQGATAIVAYDVDQATAEASSAFLKNLEEPQKNLYYILTAKSTNGLLPTILSRCQLIKAEGLNLSGEQFSQDAQMFLEADVGDKFKTVSDIKDRQEARDFVTSFILGCHTLMLKSKYPYFYAKVIKAACSTSHALRANANVGLQLTNLVVNI